MIAILHRRPSLDRLSDGDTPAMNPLERTRSSPTSIAIYKSDGVTPLDDWVPNSEADDRVGDLLSPIDDDIDLPPLSCAPTGNSSDVPKGMTEEEAFESGIVEVYGSLTKRPRLEHILLCPTIPHTHWTFLLRFVMSEILRLVLPTTSQLFPNYPLVLCPKGPLRRATCVRTQSSRTIRVLYLLLPHRPLWIRRTTVPRMVPTWILRQSVTFTWLRRRIKMSNSRHLMR